MFLKYHSEKGNYAVSDILEETAIISCWFNATLLWVKLLTWTSVGKRKTLARF